MSDFPDGPLKKSVYIKIILGTVAELNISPLFTNYSQGKKPKHGLVCNEARLVTAEWVLQLSFSGNKIPFSPKVVEGAHKPP